MRTEEEIKKVIVEIENNNHLTYSYRDDVIAVLNWVIGGSDFDGIGKEKEYE